MKTVSIKCGNKIQFEKVLLLLSTMEGTVIQATDTAVFTIRCTLPVKQYHYIKHKWTTLQIEDLNNN